MAKCKLSLQVPAEHIITLDLARETLDTTLHGHLSASNVPPECDFQITLARVGRLTSGKESRNDTASKKLLSELWFMGSEKEQKRERFDYEIAEKLCSCTITPSQNAGASKIVKSDFRLSIPSYLPATVSLPSVDVAYAVFATCTLPNGKVVQTSQDLRVTRQTAEPLRLEPSRTVTFPETTFAVRASFDAPTIGAKNTSIPTTLQLNGLKLPMNDSMRLTETRWLVPREVKWVLEETAVIITGCADATGHIPMSGAHRALKKRTLATGKEKLKLRYPFTRPGNTPVSVLPNNSGMRVPLSIAAPIAIALGDSTALAVTGGHILHTIQSAEAHTNPGTPQKRFAVFLEYKLHVWLRIGEDVFDEASGDLVNRKMDEMAYTVVCPLTASQTAASDQGAVGEEPAPMVPPSYDGMWEQQPPGYSTFS
jgi:hypothetical protein